MSVTSLPWRYLLGAFFARYAEEGMAVAVALLALQRLGDPAAAAVILFAWMAPHVVAAPVLGATWGRRDTAARHYGLALLGFGAAIAVITTLLGRVPLSVVLVVAAFGGSLGPVVSGGLSSLVAGLVSVGRQRAYALDAAGYNASALMGPALVSAISTIASASLAGYTLAAAAVSAGLFVMSLPATPAPPQSEQRGLLATLRAGAVAMWRSRALRGITAATCLAYLGVGAIPLTAVLLARKWGNAENGGLLVTAFACGALLAALVVARRRPSWSPRTLAAFSLATTAVGMLTAAIAPGLLAGLACFALAGAGDGPLLSATLQIRADHAPAVLRGHIFTTGAALKITAASLGTGAVGLAATAAPGLLVAVIGGLHVAALALLWKLVPVTSE